MAIWHRRPGESLEAYSAFELYRELGPKRSAKAVFTELNKSHTLIERWSRRWLWVARCQEFDRFYETKRAELVHDKRMKALDRQAKLGASLQECAQIGADTLLASNTLDLSPGEIAKLAETGQRIERLAMGDSTENVHEEGVQIVFHSAAPPWAPVAPTKEEPINVEAQRELSVASIRQIEAAEAE